MINKLQKWVVVCSCVRAINIRSGGGKAGPGQSWACIGGLREAAAATLLRIARDPGPGEGAADCGEGGPDIRIGSVI